MNFNNLQHNKNQDRNDSSSGRESFGCIIKPSRNTQQMFKFGKINQDLSPCGGQSDERQGFRIGPNNKMKENLRKKNTVRDEQINSQLNEDAFTFKNQYRGSHQNYKIERRGFQILENHNIKYSRDHLKKYPVESNDHDKSSN